MEQASVGKSKEKTTAILLAAGKGSRMQTDRPKQFLSIGGKLLLCYALDALEQSSVIDEILLITREEDADFCQKEIVLPGGYTKVRKIVPGGKERYDSVYAGLCEAQDPSYIFIHDGARPFLKESLLKEMDACVRAHGACVAAVPVKDTIKRVDTNGRCIETPDRAFLYQMQTPQTFRYDAIRKAYDAMYRSGDFVGITDDAAVMERFGDLPVKICLAYYENMKVTTPEDLAVAETLAMRMGFIAP